MIDELLLKIKNRRVVVLVFPVITGLIIGFVLVISPAMKKIAVVHNEKKALSEKAVVLNNIVLSESKLNGYKNRLGPITEKSQLIDRLNSLAGQAGLSVSSIMPEEKRVTGAVECMPIRIDAEGNYHQLGEFVSRVENLPQTAKIMNVDINAGSFDDTDFGSLTPGAVPMRGRAGGSRAYKMSVSVGFFNTPKEGP